MISELKTDIKELKLIINEYKNQLRRMKIDNIDNYPIIVNVEFDDEYNEWKIIR